MTHFANVTVHDISEPLLVPQPKSCGDPVQSGVSIGSGAPPLAEELAHPCVDAMWMAAATQPRENALEIFRIIADTPEM